MTKLRITTLVLLIGNVGLVLFNGAMVRGNETLRQRMLATQQALNDAQARMEEAEHLWRKQVAGSPAANECRDGLSLKKGDVCWMRFQAEGDTELSGDPRTHQGPYFWAHPPLGGPHPIPPPDNNWRNGGGTPL